MYTVGQERMIHAGKFTSGGVHTSKAPCVYHALLRRIIIYIFFVVAIPLYCVNILPDLNFVDA